MNNRFVIAVLVVILVLFAASKARAAEEVGTGIFCDTADQVREFAELMNAGQSAISAVLEVNGKASDACGLGIPVIYHKAPGVAGSVELMGRQYEIREILIVGYFTPDGARNKLPAEVQFSLFAPKGVGV